MQKTSSINEKFCIRVKSPQDGITEINDQIQGKVKVNNKDYTQSHFEFCAKNGWTKSANDGHPSEQGHHRWADNLYNFVRTNNLL